MKVITTPNPKLRQKSKKVDKITPEVKKIITAMREASLAWEEEHPYELSAAMAAPQLGENYRIIIIRDDLENKENNSFTALINPEVARTKGKEVEDFEGCLSVPHSIYGKVPRPKQASITALTEDGEPIRIKAVQPLARILLHEIDHLDGILFIDRIKNNPKAFYHIDPEDGEMKPLNYNKYIKDNPELWGK